MRKTLAICITTYQRSEILDEVLSRIMPLALKYEVPVYVNDNNSQDLTSEVLKKYSELYSIFYPKVNSENIGFDKSFEDCLRRSKEDYVWGMADYSFIDDCALPNLLKIINNEPADVIFLNNFKRIKIFIPKVINNLEIITDKLGWHITLLDSIVWSRKIIMAGKFDRYYGSLFAYYGALLEFLISNAFTAIWVSDSLVNLNHPKKNSLWLPNTFETWTVKWLNTILSLPYLLSYHKKVELIRSHNQNSYIFTFGGLIRLREKGYLTIQILWKYKETILLAFPCKNILYSIFIATLPKGFTIFLVKNKSYFVKYLFNNRK